MRACSLLPPSLGARVSLVNQHFLHHLSTSGKHCPRSTGAGRIGVVYDGSMIVSAPQAATSDRSRLRLPTHGGGIPTEVVPRADAVGSAGGVPWRDARRELQAAVRVRADGRGPGAGLCGGRVAGRRGLHEPAKTASEWVFWILTRHAPPPGPTIHRPPPPDPTIELSPAPTTRETVATALTILPPESLVAAITPLPPSAESAASPPPAPPSPRPDACARPLESWVRVGFPMRRRERGEEEDPENPL